ncbi:MAG: hypothetical protein ACE5R6_05645 [Candidatus Heimdallarchaeota archaeon]
MTEGDALHLKFLLPARISKASPFLFPVVITNLTKSPIDGNLMGIIKLGRGLTFRPLQKAEIRFGKLEPGQKIVLTWILLAEREGSYHIDVQISSQNKVVATKSIPLVVSPQVVEPRKG